MVEPYPPPKKKTWFSWTMVFLVGMYRKMWDPHINFSFRNMAEDVALHQVNFWMPQHTIKRPHRPCQKISRCCPFFVRLHVRPNVSKSAPGSSNKFRKKAVFRAQSCGDWRCRTWSSSYSFIKQKRQNASAQVPSLSFSFPAYHPLLLSPFSLPSLR